jgi:AcrR family transcriptional regulator
MKKADIRTRFTQRVLKESLLALMEQKSILDISVKEIYTGAGVGRTTFYAYCRNQYDLLRQIEDEVLAEGEDLFHEHVDMIKGKLRDDEFYESIEKVLSHIAQNRDSIQILLSKNGDPDFQKRFFQAKIEYLYRSIKSSNGKKTDEKLIWYRTQFVIGGLLALVQEWLKNGMDIPVSKLAKLLAELAQAVIV